MAQIAAKDSYEMEMLFESDAAASFLVIKCNAKVLEYQALMLEKNKIRHVVPVNVLRKEGVTCFYYNITSKISLSFFLNRRKLGKGEFLRLLLHIVAAVGDSAGYLLSDTNFLFGSEYTYINPETLEPALIYVPASLEESEGIALQSFVSDLVLQHINVDGFGSGNFVQRILAAVTSETFNIKGLITLLSELLYGQDQGEYAAGAAAPDSDRKHCVDHLTKNKIMEKAGKWRKKTEEDYDGKTNSRKEAAGDEASEGKAAANKTVEIALAILVQIVAAGAIYLCRKFINNSGNNSIATYAAMAMVVLAVEVLVFKRLTDAKLIKLKTGQESIMSEEQIKQAYIGAASAATEAASMTAAVPAVQTERSSMTAAVPAVQTERSSMTAAVPAAQTERASCKTELLGVHMKGVRLLKSAGRQDGDADIMIDKDDFIIGRLADHVDHVLKNNAVGKLHVQLIYRNGACCVKDLNSVNGTFINDKRIESNKEYVLKNDDRLRLANSEFVFRDV